MKPTDAIPGKFMYEHDESIVLGDFRFEQADETSMALSLAKTDFRTLTHTSRSTHVLTLMQIPKPPFIVYCS